MSPSPIGGTVKSFTKLHRLIELRARLLPVATHAKVIKKLFHQSDRGGRSSRPIEPVESSHQISVFTLESLVILCVLVRVTQKPIADAFALVCGSLLVCLSVSQSAG